MPCVTLPIPDSGQPLVPVFLTDAASASAKNYHGGGALLALLDTGALSLAISGRAAVRLGLTPQFDDSVHTAAGFVRVATYSVNLHIPMPGSEEVREFPEMHAVEFSVRESEGDDEAEFDVILGMDVISAGALHVSDGHFTFCI